MGFKIIVDSCCDLTHVHLSDPHFTKVPLTIQVGSEIFVDDDTLVYLSGERTASRLRRETDGLWRPDGVLSPEEGRQIMGEEFLLCCP